MQNFEAYDAAFCLKQQTCHQKQGCGIGLGAGAED